MTNSFPLYAATLRVPAVGIAGRRYQSLTAGSNTSTSRARLDVIVAMLAARDVDLVLIVGPPLAAARGRHPVHRAPRIVAGLYPRRRRRCCVKPPMFFAVMARQSHKSCRDTPIAA